MHGTPSPITILAILALAIALSSTVLLLLAVRRGWSEIKRWARSDK